MANTPKRTETLVGFFLFVGLGLLGMLILQYGRFADRFKGFYTVTVSFTDASGVIKGSAVRLSGAKVGQVAKDPKLINRAERERLIAEGVPEELITEGKVLVELYIRDDAPKLDRNSVFQIDSLSILGDKVIKITPPRPPDQEIAGVYLENNDFVSGGGPSGLDALQGEAEGIVSQGRDTLTNVDHTLKDLREVATRLTKTIDRVNIGLLSDENMENLTGALADLKGATGNIQEASEGIMPLVADAKKAVQSFDRAAEEAQGTFAHASSEISKLGPALQKIPGAVDSISGVADDARETLRSVKSSDGLLGTLAYDREVKDDAKSFLRNLRHYGVLRYRDAATFDERDPRNRFRGRRR